MPKPNVHSLTLTLLLALLLASSAVVRAHESHANAQKTTTVREQTDWGIAADSLAQARSVTLVMSDAMRFTPDNLTVRQGETLKLVIKNAGKLQHEWVLGTRATLDAHAAMMVKFPDMAHDEPYMAHVPPGQTRTLFWTFNRAGAFEFACLIAGHYQAGMIGKIQVVPQSSP